MTTYPPGDWRNNPPQTKGEKRLAVLSDQSVRLDAPVGHALLSAKLNAHLASNAYYDGTNWQRYDTTLPAAVWDVQAGLGIAQLLVAAAGANPIVWNALTVVAAAATDANGWQVAYQGDGKRRWRKRFLGVALAAATAQGNNFTLPSAVATMGIVDTFLTSRMSASAEQVNVAVSGTDASTVLQIVCSTVNGGNLSALAASIDYFVELVER